MNKPESLADFLDVPDPRTAEQQASAAAASAEPTLEGVVDISDPKQFCERVLASREFRQYILHGIVLGDIPPGIITRMMDHGWGKAPERHEHTGANGAPIKSITEVRRVIVRAKEDTFDRLEERDADAPRKVTH